ncbi:TRAP-type C4-dicarboxylate transport system, substrate-binding protein [Roseovarius nanhaiticus]|uniref:TRAP-type C4-dicarboxylate transport system, substrate-binding protein n=1 Tax=Roseovarius nanhaiticus TaxID=573024 RepID=A0A1N7H5L9_9RHOB|nr:C4-dicarboxylate TRAP transporter substrate-binding protein [Roseovarius nanhaiticus]SEL11955.1 TRAP-type C4-dicarboxylate transport system, substrate-binding protein [Roseovarius nanhaiticus]SIS20165.1 TRAP-type C4-dicarboxylate transport system, substrate-binding protein [Roseovarius nanhaiticus]
MTAIRNIIKGAGIAGIAALAPLAASAETNFIANSFYGAETPFTKWGYVDWAENVKEMSGGELVPEVFTGSVLLAPRANLQGIRDNVVQVAHHAAVYTPSELPVANAVQELGFNYSDPLVAIFAVADFSMHNETQLAEWKDKGVVYLGAYATPPYLLFCREPIRNLAELKGKRIRTAGSTVSLWVEAAGGIPVNVPSSEMYTGLERGTLDCASNAGNDLIDRSLWEVAEHTTLLPTGMYWSGPQWGVNPGFWASLTPEQRKVMMDASALGMARMNVNYIQRAEDALVEAQEKGHTVYEPEDDLMQSILDYREKALADVVKTAEEKYGLSNGQEVIDDFRATWDKWEALLADVDRTDPDALAEIAMREIYADIDPATYGVE